MGLLQRWLGIGMLLIGQIGSARAELAGDDEDQKVSRILRTKCVMCHDDLKGLAGAGVDNLLKLDELASGYGDSKQPEQSDLYRLIAGASPKMPKPRLNAIEWNGPLSESDKATILEWLRRGGPSETYRRANGAANRPIISETERIARIARDLNGLDQKTRERSRYLTLTNWHNHQNISDHELEQFRQGVVKMLNSISRSPDVLGLDTTKNKHRLIAVDVERTIFRLDISHLGWGDADWDYVAQHDPYAFVLQTEDGKQIAKATPAPSPFVRADWFVFAVSQPPLYHDLVAIMPALGDLETRLGIDRAKSIQDAQVARAGFDHSQVSVNNRLVERIPLASRKGGYHLSYDFASNVGEQNLKDHPLGPVGILNGKFAFRHDGGEVIFTMLNGFQAYALVNAAGKRIDTAPQAIVTDPTMPGGVIINGISCISCHYEGMKPERGFARLKTLDEVGPSAAGNFRRFSEADRIAIAKIYPPHLQFEQLIEQDRNRFLAAQKEAGIEQFGADEPVRLLFSRFTKDLDLNTVAADFGLSPDECRKKLGLESETRELLTRLTRGGLKRQLYSSEFRTIARLTGAGDPRDFTKLPSPYFGEKAEVANVEPAVPPKQPTDPPKVETAAPRLGKTGIDVLDSENRNGAMQVQLSVVDDRRSFVDGEVISLHVRSNTDCFLVVLSIDSTGDVEQVLPNKWHEKFELKAGKTVTIATQEMPFQFVAKAPHGLTEVKVIATRNPFSLGGSTKEQMQKQGIVNHGNLKKEGAKGMGVRLKPTSPKAQPGSPQAEADKLDKLFEPSDWATASVTFVTRGS